MYATQNIHKLFLLLFDCRSHLVGAMFAHRLVLSQLTRFFDDQQLTCELHDSISHSTMAKIIISILAVMGDAEAAAALDMRTLTKHIKDFVHVSGNMIPMSMVRPIVNQFCDANLTLEDMEVLTLNARAHAQERQRAADERKRKHHSAAPTISKFRLGAVRASSSVGSASVACPPLPLADVVDADNASGAVVTAEAASSSITNFEERFRTWDDCSESDIKLMLVRLEDESGAKDACINALRAQARKHKEKADKLEMQLVETKEELSQLQLHTQYRSGAKFSKVTTFGGYHLAAKSTIGTAGARATAEIAGGDAEQGNLRDPHTVILYEHRMAVAIRLKAAEERDAYVSQGILFEAIEIKCDSTHQSAIDKEKVHASVIGVSSISSEDFNACTTAVDADGNAVLGYDLLATMVSTQRTTGDLQYVRSGTGAELYNLVKRELNSVEIPDWDERLERHAAAGADDVANRKHLDVFCFGTDAGGENIGLAGKLHTRLKDSMSTMFIFVFCLLHQGHLISKAHIKVLDNWNWPEGTLAPSTEYFNGVSMISNLWRSAGNPVKIRRAAETVFSLQVSEQYFTKIPGRCLRGRWLAIDAVEQLLKAAVGSIGAVFAHIWGSERMDHDGMPVPKPQPQRKLKKADPGQREDDEFKAQQKKTFTMATALTNCRIFLAMVLISCITKMQLVAFMAWVQKSIREHNACCKKARAEGKTYLGPTPLSNLVAAKGNAIRLAMIDLFKRETDQEVGFGMVWTFIDPQSDQARSARMLIVTLLLVNLASWDLRIGKKLSSFPWLLLRLLEAPPSVACPIRIAVATQLLGLSAQELNKQGLFDDVTRKLLFWFLAELQDMKNTGHCAVSLYVFLLMFRARLPYESQEVEAFNNTIQTIAKLAPRIGIRLASDRLRNKFDSKGASNNRISIEECLDLHAKVLEFQNSHANAHRFLEVGAEGTPTLSWPSFSEDDVADLAKRFERRINDKFDECDYDLEYAWSFAKFTTTSGPVDAFLICWKYGWRLMIARGTLDMSCGREAFKFRPGFGIGMLKDLLITELGKHGAPNAVKVLNLHRFRILWTNIEEPPVDVANVSSFRIIPKQQQRAKRTVGAAAAAAAEPRIEPELGQEPVIPLADEDEDWLERDLESIMEDAGLAPEDDAHVDLDPSCLDEDGMFHEPADDAAADVDIGNVSTDEGTAEDVAMPSEVELPLLPLLFLDSLACRVLEGRAAREDLEAKLEESQHWPIRDKDISLVATPSKELAYVIWTNASIRMGRYITLDERNRIKAFVPYTRPPTSYADSTLIIPRTGGQLAHMSARFRGDMPVWVVEACLFHRIKGYSGPFHSNSLPRGKNNQCVFCATAVDAFVDMDKSHVREDELLHICCSCMLPWHFECATFPPLCSAVGEATIALPTGAAGPAGADFKCALCRVNFTQ